MIHGSDKPRTQIHIPGYYGTSGLMKEAPSNKAARNINGETLHAANNLMGSSSLLTTHLRPKPRHMPYIRRVGRLGAKIFDEFSQINSRMFHADAYCTAVARAAAQPEDRQDDVQVRIDPAMYADRKHSWGCLPVVVTGGDELQFPCVPAQAGLLAPIEGASNEQKTAVKIFQGFDEVYRLTTAMRFKDPVLKSILFKMRQKGGQKLTSEEWKALRETEVVKEDDLAGTELWYESAYEWSIVAMSQVVRSQLSAKEHKTPLFVAQAQDEFVSVVETDQVANSSGTAALRHHISRQILQHANMNETGRLPSFCMFHIGMRVRFTQTVQAGLVSVDQTGVVQGIDFHENEPVENKEAVALGQRPVVLLRYLPTAVHVKLERDEDDERAALQFLDDIPCSHHRDVGADSSCPHCTVLRDVVAVSPYKTKRPWSLAIKNGGGTVKVMRTQLPIVCAGASTEHVLQGSTCRPGLIFHFRFPRRMPSDLQWLAVYVALSRVEGLKNFKCIGLTSKIKGIIEGGPPDTIPAQFEKYFGAKEMETVIAADRAMRELGWQKRLAAAKT